MMKIARRSEGAHGAADAWRKRNGGALCGGRVEEAQQGCARCGGRVAEVCVAACGRRCA